jgi:hypothetical protein
MPRVKVGAVSALLLVGLCGGIFGVACQKGLTYVPADAAAGDHPSDAAVGDAPAVDAPASDTGTSGACPALAAPTNGVVAAPSLNSGATATYTCAIGYALVGPAVRTCGANGTWSDAAPTCSIKSCGALTSPTNGMVSTTGTTYGATATYTCSMGLGPSGSSTRSCLMDGTWSGMTPACVHADCPALPSPDGGTVSAPTLTFGSTATYACESGYGLTGASTRTCQTDGTWSAAAPTCTIKSCGALTAPSNGAVNMTAATYGSIATFSCGAGYTLSGAATITCQTDGTWSAIAPACVIADCGALTAPVKGSVNAMVTTYGSSATYACDNGYLLSSAATRACGADGKWAGTAPTCALADCGTLAAPTNGSVMAATTTFGATATYACATGYGPSGSATRTCQADGTWTGTAPACVIANCPALPGPTGGSVSAPTLIYGATATYACGAGYTLAGSATRTCQSSGSWSGAAPTCTIVDCGALTNPTNGTVAAAVTTYGASATYTCATGYAASASTTRTCQASGAWSGAAPSCAIKSCPSLAGPTNGSVSAPTLTYGSTATYSCNAATGYKIAGTATQTCQADGTWSGTAPTCALTDCGGLAAPTNGSVSAATTTYGATATYSCTTGYGPSGSATRTCQLGGWSGTAPTCVIANCPALTSPTGGSVSAPTLTFNSVASYSCNAGYLLDGATTRTCQANAQWSGAAPTCAPKDCLAPGTPTNGAVSAATTTYPSTANYSCNTGYTLSGASTRSCQSDGTWSGVVPSCLPVDCHAPSAPANGTVSAPTTTFGATATYSCNTSFTISGTVATRTCQSNGDWTSPVPTCVDVCTLGGGGTTTHCCTDAACTGTLPTCNTSTHTCVARAAGGACSGNNQCAGGLCLGGVCCVSSCANSNCYVCRSGSGACTPAPARTACGVRAGVGGLGQGSDISLSCDGAGACLAPTINCYTEVGPQSCDLNSNWCCSHTDSGPGCDSALTYCAPPGSIQYSGYTCATATDCPLGTVCCQNGWALCVSSCTGGGTILP